MNKVLVTLVILLLSGCSIPWQKTAPGPVKPSIRPPTQADADAIKKYVSVTATLRIPGSDSIVIELLPRMAPLTVANFVNLAEAKFYDGMIVQRVVPDLFIEAGNPSYSDKDPANDGINAAGYTFPDEISDQLPMQTGVVAMKNNGPNSNSSEFFILVADNGAPWLDGRYSIFGRVKYGFDMAKSVSSMPADANGRLINKIVIENVLISKAMDVDNTKQPTITTDN